MTEQLDTQGEARQALNVAVTNYGKRTLSDPRMLGNLVTDLLPDLPRERTLLVTAAEADVAGDLTRHVEEHHLDPDTAVQLVARSLTDRRALDPAASTWVTTEYAQALGYHTRPGTPPPPPAPPPSDPTLAAYGSQGQTAGAAGSYPGYTQPQPSGYVPPQGTGGQVPTSVPPQGPPPWQPPARPPRQRSRWPIFAGAGAAAAVVIFVAAAFAGGLFKSSPTPTPTPTLTSTPTPTASVASLIELLPGDINDPVGQCTQATPQYTPVGLVGLVRGVQCDDPGLPNGIVAAFQMNSYANYLKSLAAFNKWSRYSDDPAGSSCPLSGGNAQTARGLTTWTDLYFPQRKDQILECAWTGTGGTLNVPGYLWTFPSENAFVYALGPANSTFAALNTWWENHADPSASPTPAPPSS